MAAKPNATANQSTENLRPWPANKVSRMRVEAIIPYPKNPVIHSADQVETIAASMLQFGVTAPLLVDENGVLIYGHGRLRAALLLVSRGRQDFASLPVVKATGWSEQEKAAYRIADNQIAYLATWDMPLLKGEVAELSRSGFDMPLLGFSGDRVRQIMANPRTLDPDAEAQPKPIVPVSRAGDIWICGDHRLLCGDATNRTEVERLYAGSSPHLVVSDPPYGVNYNPGWRTTLYRPRTGGGELAPPPENSYAALGVVSNDDQVDWGVVWRASGCDVAYIWHSGVHAGVVHQSLVQAGFDIRAQIIWNKSHFALSRGDFHWKHEPCFYAVMKDGKSHWNGERTQTTVWDIVSSVGFTTKKSGPDERTGHSTQKPVECMRRPIENNSKTGDGVYDPFMGSGTTMIAAELLARRCFGVEIDPAYVDIAVRRWEKISGRIATLEATGQGFLAVAAARGVVLESPPPEQAKAPEAEAPGLVIGGERLAV